LPSRKETRKPACARAATAACIRRRVCAAGAAAAPQPARTTGRCAPAATAPTRPATSPAGCAGNRLGWPPGSRARPGARTAGRASCTPAGRAGGTGSPRTRSLESARRQVGPENLTKPTAVASGGPGRAGPQDANRQGPQAHRGGVRHLLSPHGPGTAERDRYLDPRALGHRERPALGARRCLRRGPPPAARRSRPTGHGHPAQHRYQPAAPHRMVKHRRRATTSRPRQPTTHRTPRRLMNRLCRGPGSGPTRIGSRRGSPPGSNAADRFPAGRFGPGAYG